MKWENDEYKDLKWQILDEVRYGLKKEHEKNITLKKLIDSIDEMFNDLLEKLDE
jgi:hypothetical protein